MDWTGDSRSWPVTSRCQIVRPYRSGEVGEKEIDLKLDTCEGQKGKKRIYLFRQIAIGDIVQLVIGIWMLSSEAARTSWI